MVAIALGQAMMSLNVTALPVSMVGTVQSFDVPLTTVATGIVMYSQAVGGFGMLWAKPVQRLGATCVFCAVVALLGNAQMPPTLLPVATVMLPAQHCAGLAATIIVPALVAIIATYNPTQQQATAVGALGSMRAGGGVIALLIGSI